MKSLWIICTASELFVEDIINLKLPNLVISSPDMGGSKKSERYAKLLKCEVVICYKERKQANEIGEMKVLGDVSNKDIVIIDDMVDTAGTLTKAADLMISQGASSVRAYCTHGILSKDAYEKAGEFFNIRISYHKYHSKKHKSIKVREVSVTHSFAETIQSVVKNQSISATWKSNQ